MSTIVGHECGRVGMLVTMSPSPRGSELQHHGASDLDVVRAQVENVEVRLFPLPRVPITLHDIRTL